MTGYPHRYGTNRAARKHYAIACVASAAILRREGHPDQARDLETAARDAQPPAPTPGPAPEREVPPWWH